MNRRAAFRTIPAFSTGLFADVAIARGFRRFRGNDGVPQTNVHDLKLNPKTTAVLTLDCQVGVVEFVPGSEQIFARASRGVAAARDRKIPAIHVGIGFRPGYPEVPVDHPTFGMVRQSGKFVIGTKSAAFHPSIAPAADEVVIHKHRVSAFAGTDLEMILRAKGITHLVLFGIATSGIVLSTLRQAADLDFHCVVVADCCHDGDEEVHRVLTTKVFSRQATVVTTEEFIAWRQFGKREIESISIA
jgi:nicotinamidase-related amidase